MRIATFDIGTTAVKGVLVDEKGTILRQEEEPVDTWYEGDAKEQDAAQWYDAFCRITARFTGKSNQADSKDQAKQSTSVKQDDMEQQSRAADRIEKIDAVIMSGQMQDVIPVGYDGLPSGRVILYSDGRAQEEAQQLIGDRGENYLKKKTGNHYDGSLSLPKIMWIKKHEPEQYEKTKCFLISAKDYVIYRLCGEFAGDMTACATAGAMDLAGRKWDEQILAAAGIDRSRLPKLYYPHERVGQVSEIAAKETGLNTDCTVYAGIGDAGATTLASGITGSGKYNINLGTSGWVASVSDQIMDLEGGMFNLAAFTPETYINIVPFLNAGNVHKWITSVMTSIAGDANDGRDAAAQNAADETDPAHMEHKPAERKPDYDLVEKAAKSAPAGSNGVFFLPYLNGERFPVMDTKVKGTYAGITAETKKEDLIRACLEGVAFSIRQGMERMESPAKKVSVIGGGAKSEAWCQILADVLGQEVIAFKNAQVLPALALSSLVLMDRGIYSGYDTIAGHYQQEQYAGVYMPNKENAKAYQKIYAGYLKLYPAMKAFYEE